MAELTLVAIVSRTDSPLEREDVCEVCKHYVRLDGKAAVILAAGGHALCIVCARELEEQHPGTFTPENLAKLPPLEEMEYRRSLLA